MKYIIALLLTAFSLSAADKRPNILIALADNWAFPTASAYGDEVVKTPTFDRIAENGILFNEAFCQIPSCSPARAVLLSGQAFCRLGSGANLHGFWPEVKDYPSLLQDNGYHVGHTLKGWGPGYFGNKPHKALNPAGKYYKEFSEFIKDKKDDKPFCFWFGSHDPHMPWNKGGEHKKGLNIDKIRVPKYIPDHPVVRQEIVEYYGEVQKFDYEVNEIYELLEKKGMLENTIIIMMGDNGWQAPRGLANLYDAGTKTCMAIQWPAKYKKGGKVIDSFIDFSDIAPSLLEAAGVAVPKEMTGKSLWSLIDGKIEGRDRLFMGRERHANVRYDNAGYPGRAIRTKKYLYIRNYFPDRWPAGDPQTWHAVGPYGDIDNSIIKSFIMLNKKNVTKEHFRLCFEKRPAEELYDLTKDPDQVNNVAKDKAYKADLEKLRKALTEEMKAVKDPRHKNPYTLKFDKEVYLGSHRR